MVKYCQECGNASYDNAAICGNCGAKLPPKSEANAKPPSTTKIPTTSSKTITSIFGEVKTETTQKETVKTSKESGFKFGEALNNVSDKIGQIVENLDSESEEDTLEKKRAEEEKVISRQTSSKPSFSQTATIGFKQKDTGTKNPAKKFEMPKKEEPVQIKKTSKAPKKESKNTAKKNKTITNKKPSIDTSKIFKSDEKSESDGLNFKRIGIIVIIALIILAIAGIGISNMQNQPTDEIKHFTSGAMSFNYSGNWSVYNNTNENSNSSDIAFKTRDNTLIGYTTIQSDDITYALIGEDINATAHSLNGSIIQSNDIRINDDLVGAEYIINTADQGYSRYICILKDGVYYSFVINNGKSSNQDLSALNTTEIQNMINSIELQTSDEAAIA